MADKTTPCPTEEAPTPGTSSKSTRLSAQRRVHSDAGFEQPLILVQGHNAPLAGVLLVFCDITRLKTAEEVQRIARELAQHSPPFASLADPDAKSGL